MGAFLVLTSAVTAVTVAREGAIDSQLTPAIDAAVVLREGRGNTHKPSLYSSSPPPHLRATRR